MDKNQLLQALAKAKENSTPRNFRQSYDLIINLKNIDLKKTEQQIDVFVSLPYSKGKKTRVCALIGPELEDAAKKSLDKYILSDDFQKYGKKEIKKLAKDFDFFIAQVNLMPKVATSFGKILGPRGKMPNPKAGCVVPPNANLAAIYEKLQKTIRVASKKSPVLQCSIGIEDTELEYVANNALTVLNSVVPFLPHEKHSIKDIYVKQTMGAPVKVEEKAKEAKKKK